MNLSGIDLLYQQHFSHGLAWLHASLLIGANNMLLAEETRNLPVLL